MLTVLHLEFSSALAYDRCAACLLIEPSKLFPRPTPG